MAKIETYRARSPKVHAVGPVSFEPAVGQLMTPPAYPYTGDLQFKVGSSALILSRAEFAELADRIIHARQIIAALDKPKE